MRCPQCGASNPDNAAWCGQCYAGFGVQPAATTAATERAGDGHLEGFRERDGALEWSCVVCGEYNALDVFSCGTCGASFGQRYEPDEPQVAHNWNAALALTAVLPGAGHVAAGHYGSGIARVLLFAVWLLGGVVLASSGSGGGLAAAPLLLGAVVLWAGSLLDVVRLRDGRSELLAGRALLWLVVAVLVASVVGVFGAALRLRQ